MGAKIETRIHGYHFACPDFELVREMKAGRRDHHNFLADSGSYPGLDKVNGASESEKSLDAWEEANPERCEWIRDGGQFFGWKQIGEWKLSQEATSCLYVPAVRDARQDAIEGRDSLLSRILELAVRADLDRSRDLEAIQKEVSEKQVDLLASSEACTG